MVILPGTAINNFSQLNLDWCDSLSVMPLSLTAITSLSFSVHPRWELRVVFFFLLLPFLIRPQPHIPQPLLCSLSVCRLAFHYCCLMSCKSVTFHSASSFTLSFFQHLSTSPSTDNHLCLFHKLWFAGLRWQQCFAACVPWTFSVLQIDVLI